MALAVITGNLQEPHGTIENTGEKSLPVTNCHNGSKDEEWCALQDLNLRPLPCEGSALPLS